MKRWGVCVLVGLGVLFSLVASVKALKEAPNYQLSYKLEIQERGTFHNHVSIYAQNVMIPKGTPDPLAYAVSLIEEDARKEIEAEKMRGVK